MRKLRCLEPIQCKSIYRVCKNSRRTNQLFSICLRSSKFVGIRHCSARYLKAWTKRNARCVINQKRGYRLEIAASERVVIKFTFNSLALPNSAIIKQKIRYRLGRASSGAMIADAVGNRAIGCEKMVERAMGAVATKRIGKDTEKSGVHQDDFGARCIKLLDRFFSEALTMFSTPRGGAPCNPNTLNQTGPQSTLYPSIKDQIKYRQEITKKIINKKTNISKYFK